MVSLICFPGVVVVVVAVFTYCVECVRAKSLHTAALKWYCESVYRTVSQHSQHVNDANRESTREKVQTFIHKRSIKCCVAKERGERGSLSKRTTNGVEDIC